MRNTTTLVLALYCLLGPFSCGEDKCPPGTSLEVKREYLIRKVSEYCRDDETGKYRGYFATWYLNGQKRTEGENHLNANVMLHGKRTYWHENGQKKQEIEYDQGTVLWSKPHSGRYPPGYMCWDENGKVDLCPGVIIEAHGPPKEIVDIKDLCRDEDGGVDLCSKLVGSGGPVKRIVDEIKDASSEKSSRGEAP
ncbi:MAG: hypothetical protein QNJ97_20475 [Myxococcota bacterium]|nr:hypothetical protein [Myxococcota bacterium]